MFDIKEKELPSFTKKYRPKKFSDIIGQKHITLAIRKLISSRRVNRVFLFEGSKGLGKTTSARILAQGLNCEKGITSSPCGVCKTCIEISSGSCFGIEEVDAASRTGVDSTKELMEGVIYAPVDLRYKVYIIDEIHMFSVHSFNAILKTLEDLPEYVVFCLVTTEPQKLPETVLSRAFRFHFRPIPKELICCHLEKILKNEGIDFDHEGVNIIAKLASGSMRDAIVMLEQSANYRDKVSREGVESLFGVVLGENVIDIMRNCIAGNVDKILDIIDTLCKEGVDLENLLKECLNFLHKVAILHFVKRDVTESCAAVKFLSDVLSPGRVQLMCEILLKGIAEIALYPDVRMGVEMTFLRIVAFEPKSGCEKNVSCSFCIDGEEEKKK